VRAEAKAIARALGVPIGQEAVVGTAVVEIHVIGIRAKRLPGGPFGGESLRGIILAGFGGALDPSLQIADVVVDGLTDESDGGGAFRCGRIHMARELISTPTEKSALFRQSGALAVDMEGEAVRALAKSWGVPFLHVRAISDAAGDSLDPAILGFVNEVGRVRAGALMMGLLRRPGLIPHLVRLGRNSGRAGRRLGEVVGQLVGSESIRW
jgi:adenosylhomocysteine nucleosidase